MSSPDSTRSMRRIPNVGTHHSRLSALRAAVSQACGSIALLSGDRLKRTCSLHCTPLKGAGHRMARLAFPRSTFDSISHDSVRGMLLAHEPHPRALRAAQPQYPFCGAISDLSLILIPNPILGAASVSPTFFGATVPVYS